MQEIARQNNKRLDKRLLSLVTHNWKEKALAAFLAFIFWYLISMQMNYAASSSFTGQRPRAEDSRRSFESENSD